VDTQDSPIRRHLFALIWIIKKTVRCFKVAPFVSLAEAIAPQSSLYIENLHSVLFNPV
jgi:hypothetical protein